MDIVIKNSTDVNVLNQDSELTIKDNKKYVNERNERNENLKSSGEIAKNISKKYESPKKDATKPLLNRNDNILNEDSTEELKKEKNRVDNTKKKNMGDSFYEVMSSLNKILSNEQREVNLNKHNYNKNMLNGLWSDEKNNDLLLMIADIPNDIDEYIDTLADYYLKVMNDGDADFISKIPDKELRSRLLSDSQNKFKNKNEIIEFIKSRTDFDKLMKDIKTNSINCMDKTKSFEKFNDALISLPLMDDAAGLLLKEKQTELTNELSQLHDVAETQDMAKNSLDEIANLLKTGGNTGTEYSKSLTILMGKLADLRDKMSQKKLENDRLVSSLQQKALQVKTDAESAEMAKKIEKAKRLQALFKWLGPLLIAIMVVLTALTGGLLAKGLAAVIIAVTVISEIVKATGGPDIMAKVMEPVTKLVSAIQKLIKSMAMEMAKAAGASPKELKALEEKMEIVAMLLAVVAVMALFSAAGAIAGKVAGSVVSEGVKIALKQIITEVKKILIVMMLTSTVVNAANSITQAELNAAVIKIQAELDMDQELLDRILVLMSQIMEVFAESQKELIALNEKISTTGKESYQRIKSILQNGPLAV